MYFCPSEMTGRLCAAKSTMLEIRKQEGYVSVSPSECSHRGVCVKDRVQVRKLSWAGPKRRQLSSLNSHHIDNTRTARANVRYRSTVNVILLEREFPLTSHCSSSRRAPQRQGRDRGVDGNIAIPRVFQIENTMILELHFVQVNSKSAT